MKLHKTEIQQGILEYLWALHKCHKTTENSPAVFYFSSDSEFYMILIQRSLTAGRHFSLS